MLEPTRASARSMEDLSNREKAAIILIAMGKETSAQIMRYLTEAEIEVITTEIVKVENVSSKTEIQVLSEFYSMLRASEYISAGGIDYAKDVLEASIGKSRADNILKKIQETLNPSGFSLLKDVDPIHLLEFIRNEH